jgi:TRAP-type mannitol/chloroaromatic compound transport system permease large subunit
MHEWTQYLFAALFIGFIVYRRTKRSIGFQKFSRKNLLFRTILFGVLGIVILGFGFLHPIHFAADAIGLAGGIILGLIAIRHTRFEKRETGWYYRTHLWVEVAVLVLFLGRIAYRMLFIFSEGQATAANMSVADPSQFAKDPITSGVFFIIVTYYVLYFSYLLKEEDKLDNSANELNILP